MLTTVIQTMRPAFLVLTIACVFLGLSTSLNLSEPIGLVIDKVMLTLVFIGAICAHISVNMLNEYHDFTSGLDFKTKRTPFSGGSGALPNRPNTAKVVLFGGLFTLLITVVIGIYFMATIGTAILPFGLVGILIVVTYTHWLNRLPVLCLMAPGLAFGLLMVVGTQLVLTFEHSQLVWFVACIPFFLINNLLLLNQYPDMEADASVGRKTFPLAFGIPISNLIYGLFTLAAYSLIIVYWLMGVLPALSLIALLLLPLSLFSLTGAIKHQSRIGEYPQYLATNVVATILSPLLLGFSIISG